MSKALDALHKHLMSVNRSKVGTKENEIIHQMEKHMDAIILGLIKLSRHTQNRIAAHKAHLTMQKQKWGREGLPWTSDDRVRITKKGEQALRAAKKLRVVKIKGI